MNGKALLALNLFWGVLVIGAFAVGSMTTKSRMSPGGQGMRVGSAPGGGQVPSTRAQGRTNPGEDPASQQKVSPLSSLPVPRARRPKTIVILSVKDFANLVEADLAEAKRVAASIKASSTDPNGIKRQSYAKMVVRELLTRDLDQAISFADRESIWWDVDKLAAEIADRRGSDDLLKWVDSLEYGGDEGDRLTYKKLAAREAMGMVARDDPDRAGRWLIANLQQPYVDESTLRRIAENVNEDPGLQLNWLAELPINAPDKREGIAGVFAGYIRRDLDAAAQWLAAQELKPMHDRAIQKLVDSAAVFDLEGAQAWAEEISDEALRTETLQRLRLLE